MLNDEWCCTNIQPLEATNATDEDKSEQHIAKMFPSIDSNVQSGRQFV